MSLPSNAQELPDTDIFPPLHHPNEIRVVTLQPADHIDSIPVCTLKTTSLESRPVFQAISWYVPENLYDALRYIRRRDKSIVLWVDALCINQGLDPAALDERAKQIRLMRYIYTFASHIIIWLGRPPADLPDWMLAELEKGDWVDGVIKNRASARKILHVVIDNPWWTRLWVIQESRLPERASLQLGRVSIPFRSFLDDLRALSLSHVPISSGDDEAKMQAHLALYDAVFKMGSTQWRQLPGEDTDLDDKYLGVQFDFFCNLLAKCRHQLTTDPRDKVYGLLGLVDDCVGRIIGPDYSEDVTKAYTRAMGLIFQYSNSLDLLSLANMRHPHASALDLPSWVPDWTTQFSPEERVTELKYESLVADGFPSKGLAPLLQYGKTLQTKGTIDDRIEVVGDRMPYTRGFMQWSECMREAWDVKLRKVPGLGKHIWSPREIPPADPNPDNPYPNPRVKLRGIMLDQVSLHEARPAANGTRPPPYDNRRTLYEAYWRTLFLGDNAIFADDNGGEVEIWKDWAAVLRCATDCVTKNASVPAEILDQLQTTTWNRRCFMTKGGFFGNTWDAAPGDRVATLLGARLPVVLRRVPGIRERYRFISECYVAGHAWTWTSHSSKLRTAWNATASLWRRDSAMPVRKPPKRKVREAIDWV
ncbi:hypothetical protein A1O3_06102 [Capronia epimyces CBS 606.96]|uniref:Heterokaryon incompatibility domain-containing protein n=1 Tax=Capronia epimyces CBS 606.96 TaxID=1182542 RepID=W9YJ21_9EURO|nr:uncharacterized protein A1O3_06102 [Capronia epimyces CBS 606.96]EXJ82289.1 hypothetical protein A1O3_06102 [Capronia epimyces CBS 606.96]